MKNLLSLDRQELLALQLEVRREYEAWKSRGLKLDISRGKPGTEQLDLCNGILHVMENTTTESGVDCRNYGLLNGIPESRKFFGELLGIDPARIIVCGNSSLNLMYDMIMRLMVFGISGHTPWSKLDKVKFLCPVPGYDRHFAVTAEFGIEMIPVPLKDDGPDMDIVEKLAAEDPAVKGIWCVPLYSNPSGICYSDATVERLARMKTAAPDFRIFWDNAYGVHHLYEPIELADIFAACDAAGNPNRAIYFFSTSKITFPGAGVAIVAAGPSDYDEIMKHLGVQIISYDKMNQFRTLNFLRDPEFTHEIMRRHADILRRKFEIVADTLRNELGDSGFAEWNDPRGGYFVSFNTMSGCARATYQLAREAGLTLTGAGAAFPYSNDPDDRNIRIAPTSVDDEQLAMAMELFTVCVKLAAIEKLLADK